MPSSELFSGPNAGYVEELFQRYLADPDSVSAHWGSVFAKEAAARGLSPTAAPEPARPAPAPEASRPAPSPAPVPSPAPAPQRSATLRAMQELLHLVARATSLVQAFRDHGHQLARIDPVR